MAMIAVGAGLAAAGLYGAYKSKSLGDTAKVDAYPVDAAGYEYGGDNQYYYKLRHRLEEQEKAAQARKAYQTDFSQADQDYAQQQQARGQQQAAVDEYGRVINGTAGPSLAEQQMRQGQSQAAQQAMQAAASTRGGTAGLLAAQRAAQTQGVLGQQQVAAQAGMLRAQEVQQARDAQAGLLASMRQGDQSARAGSQQQALGQAGIEMQQRALNDQRAMGLLGAQHAATTATMEGTMAYQNANAQMSQWAQGTNAQINLEDKKRGSNFAGSLLGGAGSAFGLAK